MHSSKFLFVLYRFIQSARLCRNMQSTMRMYVGPNFSEKHEFWKNKICFQVSALNLKHLSKFKFDYKRIHEYLSFTLGHDNYEESDNSQVLCLTLREWSWKFLKKKIINKIATLRHNNENQFIRSYMFKSLVRTVFITIQTLFIAQKKSPILLAFWQAR